jgi:type IV pilus assembly protein PilQ
LLLIPVLAFAQKDPMAVTLGQNTNINDAIQIIETMSIKYESRKLINLSSYNGPIGVPLNNINWKKALDLIVLQNNLKLGEFSGYISIQDPETALTSDEAKRSSLGVDTKQVRIKAIAMLADRAYMQSLGIDWSTLFNGKVIVGAGFSGASQVPGSIMNITASGDFNWGNTQVEVSTLLNAIESNQKGTIIAQPVIMVASGKKGFIQVGQDISVKNVDEAGNTTDTFFATGVIMNVLPTIVNLDGTEVVHLVVDIERSSGTPGTVSTIINKSKSSTEVILYDGEQAVIGGLYDTDEIRERSGIPILKDLPWWVFGIRYLTGYYKYEKKERELIIIIKVEIVDNVLERSKKAHETNK